MSIFFDARYIQPGFHDGISRLSANLYAEALKLIPITAIVSNQEQLKHLPVNSPHIFECDVQSPRDLTFARRMNRRGATVIFSPMQTTGSIGKKFKLILTIHDLIYFRYRTPPARFKPFTRAIWRAYHLSFWPQRWLLRSADALVTVSESTARELRSTRMYTRPITVIPNAVSKAFLEGRPKQDQPEGAAHRLIYMGTFMGYKDVETLVKASALVANSELHLVSAIEPMRRQQLQDLANRSGAKLVFHGGLPDSKYIQLLDSASLVVSASKAEGFGIPILEGFARGVPAVLSDISVFREIAGDAAEFFAPGDSDACAGAIALALEQRASLSASAQRRVTEFSWAESAKRLVLLIESLS